MAAGSSWQYKRWLYNISRNSYATNPTGAELVALRVFIKAIWNPITQTGTRSWLEQPYNRKAVGAGATDRYQCNVDVEPTHVLVELLSVIARDFGKVPMSDAEKTLADAFIAASGNRRYGTGPLFGGVGGSLVTIP